MEIKADDLFDSEFDKSVGFLKKYLVKSGEELVKSFRELFTSDNRPVYRYSGGVGEE